MTAMLGALSAIGRNTARLRWVWIGYWVLLFVVMHVRVPAGVVPRLRGSDKVAHFTAYFVLTLLGGQVLRTRHRPARVDATAHDSAAAALTDLPRVAYRRALVLWASVYLAYGAVDEWLQQFVNRSTSLADWLANGAGIVTGTLILLLLGPARSRSGSEENPRERA